MLWIESHVAVGDHPKTRKLALLLDIHVAQAVGHLHLLWHWAVNYALDGDLSSFDEFDIAIGARWDGDAKRFVESLVAAGYVDRNDDAFVLHDWHEYAGKLIATRIARAEAGRKGAKARWGDRNGEPEANGAGANGEPMAPDSTVPTNQPDLHDKPTSPSTVVDEALRSELLKTFEEQDVDAALGLLSDREKFGGEPIRSRKSWASSVCADFAAARMASSRNGQPARAEIGDEVWERQPDGTWSQVGDADA